MGTIQQQHRFSAEDRRQQIIEVATDLFAGQGYEGTTTREIAQQARVNEAIIFRHFPSKEDLYWAIIEQKIRLGGTKNRMREILEAGGTPRETFQKLVQHILRRRIDDPSLSRLLLFSALENHTLSSRFFKVYVTEYYELIADYIRQKVSEGSFRAIDPVLAARGFLGMVVYHSMIQDLFGGCKLNDYDPVQVSEVVTTIWLDGMAATQFVDEEQEKDKIALGAEAPKKQLRKTER